MVVLAFRSVVVVVASLSLSYWFREEDCIGGGDFSMYSVFLLAAMYSH